MKQSPLIAVIGGRDGDQEILQLACQVGAGIARRGGILICGGRGGVMAAACQGAVEAGGITVGILPGSQSRDANQWVTIPLATGIGVARNAVIARAAAAAIAISGKYGTLSEIAYCLQFGIPICGLRTWEIKGLIRLDTPEEALDFVFDRIG